MTYVVLFLMCMSASAWASSLVYYFRSLFAPDSETYYARLFRAVACIGWAIVFAAIVGLILIVHAVVTL